MRRLLVVLVLFVSLLAACGGDDGDTDDVASRSTTTEADADNGAEDEDSDGEAEEFSGKGSDDFCDKAREYDKKFENIGQNTEEPEKEWDDLEEAIDDIAEDAPSEIEDDIALVVKNFKEAKALYEKYDYDFSKIPPAEAQALDTEGVEEANTRLNSYMETVCKLDQDGDGDTDGVEPGSGGTEDTAEDTTEDTTADE